MKYFVVTREDIVWLSSRGCVNIDTIWRELQEPFASCVAVQLGDMNSFKNKRQGPVDWNDAVDTIWKMMCERCHDRAFINEQALHNFQQKGLIHKSCDLSLLWSEFCARLQSAEASAPQTINQAEVAFTPNETKTNSPTNDLCIAYSYETGGEVASMIATRCQERGFSCTLLREGRTMEKTISRSVAMVALLTKNSLETTEMQFALQAAMYHYSEYSRIILVHDAESCNFPVPPNSLSACFSEKAPMQTMASRKFQAEKTVLQNANSTVEVLPENIHTRVFLSHKRTTGQAIAGRLYDGLKKHYKVFLDSETKFKIHNLREIVKNTDVFIFILTQGIFLSHWCLEELLCAVEHHRQVTFPESPTFQIIVIRDLSFSLDEIPEKWKSVEPVLRSNALVWMAEYNAACIAELMKRIGPSDAAINTARQFLQCNPSVIDTLERTNQLNLIRCSNVEDVLFGVLLELKRKEVLLQVKGISMQYFKHSGIVISLFHNALETIEAFECPNISMENLKLLAPNFKNIRKLHLSGVSKDGVVLVANTCTTVTNLSLRSSDLTESGCKLLGEKCTKIEELDLSSCSLTDNAFQFLTQGFRNIQHLNLTYCQNITDIGLKSLAEHWHNIQELNLDSCFNMTDTGLKLIAEGCSTLQAINLSKCPITDDGLLSLATKCHDLLKLNLSRCKISDKGLKHVAEGCHRIQDINLDHCSAITDAGAKMLAQCFAIQALNLAYTSVGDDGLKSLAEGCRNIRELNLHNLNVTDQGLQLFTADKMEVLNLSLCSNITDSGLQPLAQRCCNIRELILDNTKIEDSALSIFAKGNHGMQKLSLEGCKITDKLLHSIAESCPNIQELNLQYCSNITDKGLKTLSEGCRKIQQLNVNFCSNITDNGRNFFAPDVFPPMMSGGFMSF